MQTTALAAIRFGLDVTVKATFLLTFALSLRLALRRASAAVQHLAVVLGLAGTLVLPLLMAAVPRISVPLVLLAPLPSGSRESLAGISAGAFAAIGPATLWPVAVLAGWAAGAFVVSARLIYGTLRVRAIVRKSKPLCDREWLETAAEVGRHLALKTRFSLLSSADVPIAMTAGARRPVLLVGDCARAWPADVRRAVLVHELAHIRRCDWLTFLLGELAVGLYWFHPLAWLARRENRHNSERACDDLVLGSGTRPSDYAGYLLQIVRALPLNAGVSLPVLAMARPSQFEDRLRAILDPRLGRAVPSGRFVRVAAVVLIAAAAALSALEPSGARPKTDAALRRIVAVCSNVASTAPAVRFPPAKAAGETKPARPVKTGPAKTKCHKTVAKRRPNAPVSSS